MNYKISINENLNRILTTKKGSLVLNPNYGLSYDWIDRPLTRELELSVVQEIREQIQLYEPRLRLTSIQVLKKDASLELAINTDLRFSL